MPTMPARPPAKHPRTRKLPLEVQGSMWFEMGGQSFGGPDRMALLQAVQDTGSITQAAAAVGLSYKTAWTVIDAMNALAGTPLVVRAAGGAGGGGTRLTDHGRRLLERYGQLDAAHQHYLRLLSANNADLTQDFSLLKVLNMKTSARNQWVGTISAIRAGAVNDEVEVLLQGGARLTVIVTRESTDALELRVQKTVIALVKSSAVLLATDLEGAKVSARNRLDGTVRRVQPGSVNAEVTVRTADGLDVVAIVTSGSVQSLALEPGRPVTVLVKASDVILATIS